MQRTLTLAALALTLGLVPESHAQLVRSATGADAAAIQATVDQFRDDLGVNNGVGPCAGGCLPGVGRREVNWDAVPDASASPNPFPGNFFNLATGNPAGRVRGIEFSTTPNATFEVSSSAASGVPVLFGNRNPENANQFAAFSAERIFGLSNPVGFDVEFSVPGEPGSQAAVRGFGVVFTDVEVAGAATLAFYDAADTLLHTVAAEPFPLGGAGDSFKSFSFVGVSFTDPVVARVHVTSGDYTLAFTQVGSINDAVAMDDLVFGEPVRIPEPTTIVLTALAIAGFANRRR